MPDIGGSVDIGWSGSSSGGGGSGTVTSITAGTGLSGGTITTSGTIAVANSTANTLAGYNASGVFSDVAIGAGLSLSSGTLSATSGGVTSFTGDGTILSNSSSTGAVTATLSNAAAFSGLTNLNSSSAAPAYNPVDGGVQTLTGGTVTLTATSPSYNYCTGGSGTYILPVSTTVGPLKRFYFMAPFSAGGGISISRQSSDVIRSFNNSSTSTSVPVGFGSTVEVRTDGAGTWYQTFPNIMPTQAGGTGTNTAPTSGGIVYGNSIAAYSCSAAGTNGQLLQSVGAGSSPPTWTSTPGSGTALTSVTAVHQIAAGTAPTVAVGAGAGTGGSPSASISGHDTDFTVTLTTGTAAATGVIFTVTFGTAYASAPFIQLTSGNANAASLMTAVLAPYATSTTTTMVLNSGTTGITAAGAQYIWYVHCGQ